MAIYNFNFNTQIVINFNIILFFIPKSDFELNTTQYKPNIKISLQNSMQN